MIKITKSLVLISLAAIVLDLARLELWGTANLFYLISNLFLAWIPYLISLLFIRKDMPLFRFIPIFIIWLLFFPNAPYLVTDVLHIASGSPAFLWYDSLIFFLFGWIGLLLGVLSLFHIHRYIKNHVNYFVSEIIVFIICLAASFGIYLGRFERWNSWDLFRSPRELVRHSTDVSSNLIHNSIPILFVLIFTIFLYLTYQTVFTLIKEET